MRLIRINQPSVDRFAPELESGGLLVANASMVARLPDRADLRVLSIPATAIAHEIGDPRANMVLLGAYLGESGTLDPRSVLEVLRDQCVRPELLELNARALEVGRGLTVPA